jgi:hypothetical protein
VKPSPHDQISSCPLAVRGLEFSRDGRDYLQKSIEGLLWSSGELVNRFEQDNDGERARETTKKGSLVFLLILERRKKRE